MNGRFCRVISSGRGNASPLTGLAGMLPVAGALLLTLCLAGCSISTSISDSVSSPFKWSSSISGGEKEAYQDDVRDYTEAYVRSSSDIEGFRKGLASLAEKRGISNWEADEATYLGIGAGLAKAQVKDTQLEVYKNNFAKNDAVKAAAIQKGYDQVMKEK
ncbi:MAG TPA: putative lipoprotein [Geobacteraceae bacterium]|nr:putative lipoprotein [Geobacteraceae bacterium]